MFSLYTRTKYSVTVQFINVNSTWLYLVSFYLKVTRTMFESTYLLLILQILFCFGKGGFSEYIRSNVAYGSDLQQNMDIYTPEEENDASKVIVIIHGGGWHNGMKEELNDLLVKDIRLRFPKYTVANMNYRWGRVDSPGYPKQIHDLDKACKFLKSDLKLVKPKFALIGVSAGAHLALLYGFGFDKQNLIKVVVNIVGPTDFTDPDISGNVAYNAALTPLMGPTMYFQNPGIYNETSPLAYLTEDAVPTISFYGLSDPIVPISQGRRLVKKLKEAEVTNYEYYEFPGGHYVDWLAEYQLKMKTRISDFFKIHF